MDRFTDVRLDGRFDGVWMDGLTGATAAGCTRGWADARTDRCIVALMYYCLIVLMYVFVYGLGGCDV